MCTVTVHVLHRERGNLLLQSLRLLKDGTVLASPISAEKNKPVEAFYFSSLSYRVGGETESMRGLKWAYCSSPSCKINMAH
jgi:hypothetical protein